MLVKIYNCLASLQLYRSIQKRWVALFYANVIEDGTPL
jgi:hypothetical protein